MDPQKIALFRFEASKEIGLGHAMRCFVLTQILKEKNWKIAIITSLNTYHFFSPLEAFERIDPDEFNQNPFEHDLLVFDHYDLDIVDEQRLRPYAKQILVIDDLANRAHDCDILVDQTYGRDPCAYEKWVPPHCLKLIGPQYALLRSEFAALRPFALTKRKENKSIERILISLGGSDPHLFSLKALEQLHQANFLGKIDVVLGYSHDALTQVKMYQQKLNMTIHTQVKNIAELMLQADLAIGAAGSSAWERLCLGLPSILIQTASNQETIFHNLIEHQLAYELKDLAQLLTNTISLTLPNIVDGFGANRVIWAMNADPNVHFRAVQHSDKDLIFSWQQETQVRRYCLNTQAPSQEEHYRWFNHRIKQYENPYWMICYDNIPCGTISLTFDDSKKAYELGWYLSTAFQGKGIGTLALKQALEIVQPIPIKAFVKSENTASLRSLTRSGFIRLNENHFISKNLSNEGTSQCL